VLAVVHSTALNTASYVVGEKQHVDGLLGLVQIASLLRVMCGGGGVSSLLSSSPKRDLFPKGPASVFVPFFFLTRLLLYGLLVWRDDGSVKSAASVELHTWLPRPSNCTHHLVISIPASLSHVSRLLTMFKTGIIEFCGNWMMLQTWHSLQHSTSVS
jgi:hypothetical protein